MKINRVLGGFAILVGLCNGESFAGNYTIIELGVTGGSNSSYAYDLNNSGQVVGFSSVSGSNRVAAMWTNGNVQSLGTLGGTSSQAYGINDLGQVVGTRRTNSDDNAAIWTNGTGELLGTNSWLLSYAYDINNIGQVIGGAWGATAYLHATLWSNGSKQDLGTLGGELSTAYGVNDSGMAVGTSKISNGSPYHLTHAARWSNGVVADLGTLGGNSSWAYGVNESGQVVGYADTSVTNARHAALWQSDGTINDLGTLGGTMSNAFDINDAGQVVGSSFIAGDRIEHAVIWENGQAVDLNTLFNDSAWVLTSATGINEHGQIVANGINNAFQTRAFLLTPVPTFVPEPTTVFLLGGGLLGLALCQKRKHVPTRPKRSSRFNTVSSTVS